MIKKILFGSTLALMLWSCGGNTSKNSETQETIMGTAVEEVTTEMNYFVNTETSQVMWKGEVAGVYGHNGIVTLKQGSLEVSGEMLTGGSFVVDMTTITPTDSSYEYTEKSNPDVLVAHLSSGDFFLVDSFPTAMFVIKSHEGNILKGDLTIRDKTKEETVEISSLEQTETGLKASGKLVFNRQDYDVAWKHYMKDMVLSNDITLDIMIEASSNN